MKMYPLLGMRAIKAKQGNPWRVWTVAKSLDYEGSGWVCEEKLRARLRRYEVPESSIYRLITEASRKEWILREDWKPGFFKLPGPTKIASKLDAVQVGRAVKMDGRLVFTIGWKANVWAGVIRLFDGKPISRATLEKLTGIPRRTQAHYRRQASVNTRPNYAKSELSVDHLVGIAETRPGAFAIDQTVAWRLPDTRFAPDYVEIAPKGRTRKHKQELGILSYHRQDKPKPVPVKLFYQTLRRAQKAASREAYYLQKETPCYAFYGVVSC